MQFLPSREIGNRGAGLDRAGEGIGIQPHAVMPLPMEEVDGFPVQAVGGVRSDHGVEDEGVAVRSAAEDSIGLVELAGDGVAGDELDTEEGVAVEAGDNDLGVDSCGRSWVLVEDA